MSELTFSINELTRKEAEFSFSIPFITQAPLPKDLSIMGQPRALRALSMGMSIRGAGYNIFISGQPGSGRLSSVYHTAATLPIQPGTLHDIAYVHNFVDPESPEVLILPPGDGVRLHHELQSFLGEIKKNPDSSVIENTLAAISAKFPHPKVSKFLNQIKQDIAAELPYISSCDKIRLETLPLFSRYQIKLLVDRSETQVLPVVHEQHPTFETLFGSVDTVLEPGISPIRAIQGGSLLAADGGFWVVHADQLLSEEGLWEALKRFMTSERLIIQESQTKRNSSRTPAIRPQPVPVCVKIIIIGDDVLYDKLCDHDSEFLKLFKVSAEFDYSMPVTPENIGGTIAFIKQTVTTSQLLPVTDDAIAELLRLSCWYVEHRDELTTQFSFLQDILKEADFWAKREDSSAITGTYILKALNEREYVSGITEERINNEIASGEMLISLTGSRIGRVNGLAVMDRGLASFGTPTVISATVAPGSEGIVNIEHEVGLSGEIHDKGLLILEGYLRKQYARNFPVSMYAGICFEQSYAEVDGDSASISELFALLSAIGEIPIRQDIAVTGSVNQMGEVQPVGGINEKIAGFFTICEKMGLSGHQGVIIPKQNINSLILPYPVLDAIGNRKFHIYPIETADEGMQILTSRPAGSRTAKGLFPPDTVNRQIEDRLKKLYELSRPSS